VGLAVATGVHTEVGVIATELAGQAEVQPPLIVRMEQFTRTIMVAAIALCAVTFAIGTLRGFPWEEMLYFALAMAVSIIPEGLPVALTAALAIAVKRMARRNVLVRRLAAVEALGSCSVIGSDKTGTLTVNHLTVVQVCLGGEMLAARDVLTGAPLQPGSAAWRLSRALLLCNEATLGQDGQGWRGDSTDVALAEFGARSGIALAELASAHPRLGGIPFEPELQYAASFHSDRGTGLTAVKGAPERVLAMCATMWDAGRQAVVPVETEAVRRWVRTMAEQGQRVLALAEGPGTPAAGSSRPSWGWWACPIRPGRMPPPQWPRATRRASAW
jgi:magnesium-transporting ATPase (P-type)